MRRLLVPLVFSLLSTLAQAAGLDALSPKDANGGIKEALTQGAGKAVDVLGRSDGFLGNPKVRIGLPGGLEQAAPLLRGMGLGTQLDDLVTTMNRAAEAAVPQARTLLVNAVKQMSVADAQAVLGGGDDAATQYFRRTTAGPLAEKFRPIVKAAVSKLQLADKYDALAGKAKRFGVVKEEDSQLDGYVTQRALDGLYLMIAEEEKAIRQNPAQAAGKLAQKVFGVLH